MALIHNTIKWEQFVLTRPTFAPGFTVSKPTQISSSESDVVQITGQELISLAKQNTDLFGSAQLDLAALDLLDPDLVLQYYLNVRYAISPKLSLLPLRRQHVFTMIPHAYPWYILLSAILTRQYELTYSTIDPHLKWVADQLLRTIRQLNYCIFTMTADGIGITAPTDLIIAVGHSVEADGLDHLLLLDETRFLQWEALGNTAEQALAYWNANREQPAF